MSEIQERIYPVLVKMVRKCCEIKAAVVESDPTEQGERALLNYGHTLGHAIEKLADFKLMHGHCVGLGCIAAMGISAARGALPEEALTNLKERMERFHMPVTVSGLSAEDIIETTKSDKKMDSGTIRFVLLEEVGKAYLDRTVTDDEMNAGLSRILA